MKTIFLLLKLTFNYIPMCLSSSSSSSEYDILVGPNLCLSNPPVQCDEPLPGYYFHARESRCVMTQFAFCNNASNSFEFLEECEMKCLGHETESGRRLKEKAFERLMEDSAEQLSRR